MDRFRRGPRKIGLRQTRCNVNLDYIYTSYHRGNSLPIMILQTDDVFVTENVLTNNGFRVLNSLEG